MGTRLDDFPIVHDDDDVSGANCGQAVRNDESGPRTRRQQAVQGPLDEAFALRVERRRGLDLEGGVG